MRRVRRISQIIFLLLFIYLFLQATYPYESFIPADIFLRSSPLIALTTIIAERNFITTLIPAFILLLLTIPLGRFFCGWICPLGTLIDASDRLLKAPRPKVKTRTTLRFRSWKFFILGLVFVAGIFSIQLIWFFDPIALLTRTFTTTFFPMVALMIESILGVIIGIEWLEEMAYTVYDWLHASVLPLEPHYFQNGLIFFLIFLAILLAGKIMPRFWCRNLCPLGALLGIFSKYRIMHRVVADSCTRCGICQRDCKMNAIEDDFTENSTIECIECLNCVAVCPVNCIRYQVRLSRTSSTIDLSRRQVLGSALAGVVTVGVIKTGYLSRDQKGAAIRPPGALPEPAFLDRCVRCHECTRICSTTGSYLQPALFESGLEGLWTPIGKPRTGFCEFNCNLCGQVCPTGAIQNLDLEQKKQMKMGTASFDKNRCIPWYRLENCLVCEEHCPIPDKAIQFDEREVIRPDGQTALVKFPYVKEERCVGCGMCVVKCPLPGKAGIFVSNVGEIRVESV